MSNLFTTVSVEQQEIVAGGVGNLTFGNLQFGINVVTQTPTAVVVGSGTASATARSRQRNDIRNRTVIIGNN